jgi:hypothetical protein
MPTARAVLPLILLASACAGTSAREPATASSASAPAPASASAPAAAPASAPAPASASPPASAKPAPLTAETCEGVTPCAALGLALAKKGDPSARVALTKACTGHVVHIDACAVLAAILDADPSAGAAAVVDAARSGCVPLADDDADKAARGKACATFGEALRNGKGVDKDVRTAERAFKSGCRLGDDHACAAGREMETARREAAADETGVPGANMTVGSITTDGATVRQIACRTEGGGLGGLFGSLALGKPFADKKKALDACAKGAPHETRVRWTGKGGRMTDVHVISGEHPSNKCVERALAGSLAPVAGTCAATVDIGKRK